MNAEFECPGCRQSLSVDVPPTGLDVTCPACNIAFHVDAPAVALPTVQARPVNTRPTPGPQPGHFSAHPGPHSPHPGMRPPTGVPRPQPRPPETDSSISGGMIAGFLLAGVVLAGGGYGIYAAASKSAEPPPAQPSVVERARQEMAEWNLKEVERMKREAEERQKDIEKNRAEIAVREKEDAARLEREKDEKITDIAEKYFEGNKSAAAELLKEMEAVNEEINGLFADNVRGNEPQTQDEFHQTWSRLLERRIKENPVFAKFAGDQLHEFSREPLNEGVAKNSELLEKYRQFGSGFFISPDGWLVTNRHVVGNADKADIRTTDGEIVPARVVARDEKQDLALLKADVKSVAWLPVSQGAKELELGGSVFTIGFPNPIMQGLEPKYTDGRISSRAGLQDNESFYQISVPVQPGNSGGPLVDLDSGWAVGVITLRLDRTADGRAAENVSYALKGSVLHTFVSGTPEAAKAMKASAPEKRGDSKTVIARTKGAAVAVLIPN